MELGNKIIKLRKREKLSQESLADKLGVTRQTISNWELNITKPDISQIKKISKKFNISIDELVDNEIKDPSKKKVNNEELIITKNKKNRIIFITIYFIILFFLISFIIYCLTKKDFTNKYQTEITCILEGENYVLALDEDENGLQVIVSKYNEEEYFWSVEERYQAGSSVDEALKSLHSLKKVVLDLGATCK